MNRYQWSVDVRCGCEVALKSFISSELSVKRTYPKAAKEYERAFRELERDHKVLIARTRRLEALVKDGQEFDFEEMRTEIHAKVRYVRNKYKELTFEIAEKESVL